MNAKRIGSIVALLVAAAVVGAFTLLGPKVLDLAKAKTEIQHLLTTQAHLTVKSVRCPSDPPKVAKGTVTYCTATLASDHTVRMSITQTNNDGHVWVQPAEMISDEIEQYVDRQLAAQGVSATTICPQHEPIVIGSTFDCVASDNAGHAAKIAITVRNRYAGFIARVAS